MKDKDATPATDLRLLTLAYLEHRQALHYSPRTIGQHKSALNNFADWCELRSLNRANEITKPILERYRKHLHHTLDRTGKPLTARNQVTRLIPLRSFFKWATRQNYLLYNPASELELPKLGRRLPKATLTAAEADHVLAQPDTQTQEGIRDRAILEVLYSTGIRRMELINLCLEDVQASRGVLAVRQGKNNKDRFVPIGERAVIWLQEYIDHVRPFWVIDDHDSVFLNQHGQALKPDQLTRWVRNYIEQADIGKPGSCHLFRHTVATLMLENGADLRFIQQMLGHVSILTTEIYTHVSIIKLQEIHSVTHPARLDKNDKDALLAQLEKEARDELES